MKYRLIFVLLFFNLTSCLQTETSSNIISFVHTVDIDNATKGGIYMNGYVVEINYEKAKILNGKKVRITGKAIIVKGLVNDDKIIRQGRSKDVIHITSPKIELIKD